MKDDNYQFVDNPVKFVCEILQMTQTDIAELLGVHVGSVNRWASHPDKITDHASFTLNLLVQNHLLRYDIQLLKSGINNTRFFDDV